MKSQVARLTRFLTLDNTFSSSYSDRFFGIARLYGKEGLKALQSSHVLVVGIGGVGSWVVESLARSGVGQMTLVDHDDICVSNFNRQIHSLNGNVGKFKVEVMRERVLKINEECKVTIHSEMFGDETAEQILSEKFDYVVDAIDSIKAKCLLLSLCHSRKIPVITMGGAGGRKDPSKIKIADLSQSRDDALLKYVRRNLRQHFNFPKKGDKKFKIPCVYSDEKPVYMQDDGCVTEDKPDSFLKPLDCETGFGTAAHITATFGFFGASYVIHQLTQAKTSAE